LIPLLPRRLGIRDRPVGDRRETGERHQSAHDATDEDQTQASDGHGDAPPIGAGGGSQDGLGPPRMRPGPAGWKHSQDQHPK
jgi:hypothetical protein